MANVIITKAAREKMVKARAGAITLPIVTGMVFGDGGVDENGEVIAPVEAIDGALGIGAVQESY